MKASTTRPFKAEFIAVELPRHRAPGVRDPQQGVFAHLIDLAAFIDRIRIGVEGVRREHPLPPITVEQSFAIGGPAHSDGHAGDSGQRRPYARAVNGICLRSGNLFQLRYGANRLFPNLSSLSLDLRSEKCPLTVEECDIVLRSLFRAGFRKHVAHLEWTCDLSGTSVEHLANHYVSRATYFRELTDSLGFRTVYIGSPNSPWQLKIYDKANDIVRSEYAFRRPFLRGRGIVEPSDVIALSGVDSAQLVRFCDLMERPSKQVLSHIRKAWVIDLLADWPPNRPLQAWAGLMRGWKVDPAPYLGDDDLQRRVRGMHERLIW
jgi:hypothetical protein